MEQGPVNKPANEKEIAAHDTADHVTSNDDSLIKLLRVFETFRYLGESEVNAKINAESKATASVSLGSLSVKPEDNFFSPRNDSFYASGIYRPLNPKKKEIRLIKVLPGSWDEPIECEILSNVSLSAETPPVYKALSYAAGDHRQTSPIKVDSQTFNAFATLGVALRQLRPSLCGKLIWVDQICINQSDFEERSHQVLQMRTIYRTAEETFVWLGAQDNRLGMLLLHDIYSHWHNLRLAGNDSPSLEDSMAEINATRETGRWLVTNLPDVISWRAAAEVFQASWWNRCWVIQELIVSTRATMIWGETHIPWSILSQAGRIINIALALLSEAALTGQPEEKSKAREMLKILDSQWAGHLLEMQQLWSIDKKVSLRRLLNYARCLQSTDPRDRVYAFLGLADPSYEIIPNYDPSNTPANVFHQATKAAILRDQSLNLLCDGQEEDRHKDMDGPSWVPDFTVPPGTLQLCKWRPTEKPMPWDFSASAAETPSFQFSNDSNGGADRVLRVMAIDIEQIAEPDSLGDILDLSDSAPQDHSKDNSILMPWIACMPWYHPLQKYGPTGELLPEAFSKTISLEDRTEEFAAANPGSSEYEEAFKNSLEAKRFRNLRNIGTRRFFVTPSSDRWEFLMGMAPKHVQYTDRIFVILGVGVPLVIRKREQGGFILVGEAYVHGYMFGRVIEEWRRGERKAEWIDLY